MLKKIYKNLSQLEWLKFRFQVEKWRKKSLKEMVQEGVSVI